MRCMQRLGFVLRASPVSRRLRHGGVFPSFPPVNEQGRMRFGRRGDDTSMQARGREEGERSTATFSLADDLPESSAHRQRICLVCTMERGCRRVGRRGVSK
jgi:hypothetical protein